jgi:UDP-glucose 4-epimerase
MRILVTGGAGYIGSHMVRCLQRAGHVPLVVDNLSAGHRQAVRDCELVVADLRDAAALDRIFDAGQFEAVMHFAGKISVAESMLQPGEYRDNNVTGTLSLLEAMRKHGVQRMIFSSTAAVYGLPQADILDETHPRKPISPYGVSKLQAEQILADAAGAGGVSSVSLRYFNAAGASPDGDIGESHVPETHLIPNVLMSALNPQAPLSVFGNDYPTPDGTCIRDFIHVDDLAEAHLLALEYLSHVPGAHALNLGSERGFSVLEVLEVAREVTGQPIHCSIAPRRLGDSPVLVASSRRARERLGWQPRYIDLRQIIETAWNWHRAQRF